jgi:hypothetical protein
MTIDHTILALVDRGIPPEAVFQWLLNGAAEIEALQLEEIAAVAIARGFNEVDVRREIAWHVRDLTASRAQRLGYIRDELEARARLQ